MGACAFVVYDETMTPIKKAAKLIGDGPAMTNNVAEWRSLRGLLRWVVQHRPKDTVQVYMDSQLVVNQFNEKWECRQSELRAIMRDCLDLSAEMDITLTWVPRAENAVADELINQLYARSNIPVMRGKGRFIRT
jgi:ribonuclease HI